ncbi:MAG: glycosyltransferase [Smithellaceae bacterium]
MGPTGDIRWTVDALQSVFNKLDIVSLPYNDTGKIFKRFFCFLPVWITNTFKMPVASLRVFLDKAIRLKLAEFVRIHNDAYLFDQGGDADIIHFQFATLANRYSQMVKYGFVHRNAAIACSVRGYDISRNAVVDEIDWNMLIKDVSLFLPVCDFFRPVLERKGFRKVIRVVGSPVDTNKLFHRKKERGTASTIRIVSVGRLIEKKGFDDALKALSIVKQSFGNFRYTIIGNGPLYRMLSNIIFEYGLSGQVDLKGEMPSGEALDVMAEADILIAPSKTGSDGEVEGIPNVLKEAMAMGLQVIATRHAGIPELISHGVNGLLVSENSPEEIAGAIEELIINRRAWAARAERAAISVLEQYAPDKTTQDLMDAYKSILNENQARQQ